MLTNLSVRNPAKEMASSEEAYNFVLNAFRKMKPSIEGMISTEESVKDQLVVINNLTSKQSGQFLSQHGNRDWFWVCGMIFNGLTLLDALVPLLWECSRASMRFSAFRVSARNFLAEYSYLCKLMSMTLYSSAVPIVLCWSVDKLPNAANYFRYQSAGMEGAACLSWIFPSSSVPDSLRSTCKSKPPSALSCPGFASS